MIFYRMLIAAKAVFFLLRKRPAVVWQVLRAVKPTSWINVFSAASYHPIGVVSVRLHNIRHPVYIRGGTSDFSVLYQVLVSEQYSSEDIANARYILDAGANIGLTSLLMLDRNPTCQIISVEPDPHNCEVASINLAPYGERCRLIQGAIWSDSKPLVLSRGTFRDGNYWATQTLPASGAQEATVPSYTVGEITKDFPSIDYLKMDIEGAELNVFRDGDLSFLEKTKICAVETHDDDCYKALTVALEKYGFKIEQRGEVTFGIRPKA
jgi:FkbM family methyltransferase